MANKLWVVGGLLLFTALGGGALVNNVQEMVTQPTANETCAVEYQGEAATMVVYGVNAQRFCNTLVKGNNPLVEVDGTPALPVICQFMVNGLRITVRDSGLHFIGSQMCDKLSVLADN